MLRMALARGSGVLVRPGAAWRAVRQGRASVPPPAPHHSSLGRSDLLRQDSRISRRSFAASGRDDSEAQPTTSSANPVTTERAASGAAASTSAGNSNQAVLTLPTILTLGRVAAIPALIAVWYSGSPHTAVASTAIFAVASLTDWLDGYLARKLNAYSAFGAFLDPVADKLMVAAVLVLLCTQPLAAGPLAGNDWLVPVATMAIIGREITMSALREWAATAGPEARAAVAVNAWGKWKTAAQMSSLTLLLLCKDGGQGPLMEAAATAGPVLLVIAAWLTVQSLAIYMRGLWKHFATAAA